MFCLQSYQGIHVLVHGGMYLLFKSGPETIRRFPQVQAGMPAAHFSCLNTINSEIFARVLFSRNFAYAKFRENKILEKWRNHSVVY